MFQITNLSNQLGIDYPIKNSTHTFEDNKVVFDAF